MTDQQIIDALAERDSGVTEQFLFRNCRPLFLSIIRNVFNYEVDYDEFVNEFYLYLMENDAYRLRQFQGRSSIYQWLKVVAIRYFIARRKDLMDQGSYSSISKVDTSKEVVDVEKTVGAKMDMKHLFELMPNKRYVHVINRLVLQDVKPEIVADELDITVDNLYNVKRRAMASLAKVALMEVGKYEK